MDVSRVTGAAGVAAALLAAVLLPASALVIAAGVAGAIAAVTVDRDTPGLAAGSLALAAATSLTASAVTNVDSAGAALGSLFVAAGLAGCLTAAFGRLEPDAPSRNSARGAPGGGVAGLLGAWTALVLPSTAALALLLASSQPFGSFLSSRLAVQGVAPVLLGVPVAVAVASGWAALASWRAAGLPPWPCTVGPAALLVGVGALVAPETLAVDALLVGNLADGAPAYVLLWSTATALVASALAGVVAAEDPRFRRGPAWVAVAAGPLALAAFVAAVDGGPFVAAALAALPPAADSFGVVVETVAPSTAAAFLAALSVSGLAFAAALLARAPLARELTAGRPAGVGAGCLLVAVALAGVSAAVTALAGGFAVLSWVLLAAEPAIAPPPRTALSRAGVATLAVGCGAVAAVPLVGLAPRTEPGVGAALLLVGVSVLGAAIR
ncbi:hypothetical protein HWV07_09895 [Natronomonas salina]|uniref:hypothetical protein n=1 Tax=Natronomonas salina TaxID=1710540 RepID=UPI0015B7085E|nr:hypothetical protein [Natronomonas salina]QLD89322.1 hypothetical protein HWV07_09895 [Natronomonas salina]